MFSFPFAELSMSKTSNEECTEADPEADADAEADPESPPEDPKRFLSIWLLTGDDSDKCEPVLRGEMLDKNGGVAGEVFDISEAESYLNH